MAFLIEDSDAQPYIKVSVVGRVDNKDLRQFQEDIFTSAGFETKDQLVNYSLVTEYEISVKEMEAYCQQLELHLANVNARENRKIALVASKDLIYAMGRVFMANTVTLPSNYRVYRTEAEALAWFEEND